MPSKNKTARVEFDVVVIQTATSEKELLGGTPVFIDSKHLYLGHDANWRWSLKKQVEDIEFDEDGGLVMLCDNKHTRVECNHVLDDDASSWKTFQATLEKQWNKVKESRAPVVEEKPKPKRRPGRVYGKHSRSRKTLPYTSWNYFSDDDKEPRRKEQPTEGKYFNKKKPFMHDKENTPETNHGAHENVEMMEEDNDDDMIDETQQQHAESDDEAPVLPKKRKRLQSSRHCTLDESDDDDNDDLFTTPLTDTTRVVSPPQAADQDSTTTTNDKSHEEQEPSKRITQFFAPQAKKSASATRTPASPVRPRLSPFCKEDDGPKSVSKRPMSLSQDTEWLERPRPNTPVRTPTKESNSMPTTLHGEDMEDEIISTPPRPFTPPPPPQNTMSRYLSHKSVLTSPKHRRRKFMIRPRVSQADAALSGTPSRSLVLTTSNRKEAPSMKKQLSSSPLPPPATPYKGLFNLGNTCYLNASVQALYSIPSFVDKLKDVVDNSDDSTCKLPLSSTLSQIFQQLSLNKTTGDPTPLKSAIDTLTDKFTGKQQRDAHEFMAELIDGLHEELSSTKVSDILDEFFRLTVKVCLQCDSCGYKRCKDEMYRHLSIDVVGDDDGWSIPKGLNQFFKPEKREIKCEKCSAGKTATQTQTVTSHPKALLLHLKRFVLVEKPRIREEEKENRPPVEMTFRKNKARVQIPDNISLSSYMEKDVSPKEFRLKSVVHHIGSTAFSGHYTADALRKKEWITFDDTCTSICDKSRRNEATAYMLLYGM